MRKKTRATPQNKHSKLFKGKVILITGGTGSFGRACVETLLKKYHPKVIRIYSRDELKQWEMERAFGSSPKLRFLIGDVRDAGRLKRATEGVDVLIHAAALKHVPACEYNPVDAVRTNVDGTINVINAALDNNVPYVMMLSTDKAVNPTNIYGATKLCAERLVIQSNSYRGATRKTRFSVVRYGNVMGSRGSVIPLFREQRARGEVTITDPRMTRFWITLPRAIDFVLSSIGMMQGGEVFVPKIPSMHITDLARVIAPKAKQRIVGMRAGERLDEYLMTREESNRAFESGDRYVIIPSVQLWKWDRTLLPALKKVKSDSDYNSRDNPSFLSARDMQKIIADNHLA